MSAELMPTWSVVESMKADERAMLSTVTVDWVKKFFPVIISVNPALPVVYSLKGEIAVICGARTGRWIDREGQRGIARAATRGRRDNGHVGLAGVLNIARRNLRCEYVSALEKRYARRCVPLDRGCWCEVRASHSQGEGRLA